MLKIKTCIKRKIICSIGLSNRATKVIYYSFHSCFAVSRSNLWHNKLVKEQEGDNKRLFSRGVIGTVEAKNIAVIIIWIIILGITFIYTYNKVGLDK